MTSESSLKPDEANCYICGGDGLVYEQYTKPEMGMTSRKMGKKEKCPKCKGLGVLKK